MTALTDKISEEVSKKLINKVSQLDEKLQKIELVVEYQKQFSRNSNIRIYGILEVQSEIIYVKVVEICHHQRKGHRYMSQA